MKITMSDEDIEQAKAIALSYDSLQKDKEIWLKVKVNDPTFATFIFKAIYSPQTIDGVEF